MFRLPRSWRDEYAAELGAMTDLAIARALHVIGIVIWIGGVSMATTVVLPAVRRGDFGSDRIAAFKAIEGRFVWQARAAVLIVGATGAYMAAKLDLWGRFADLTFWWMHAMAIVWLLFALILFVGEPFVLHRVFPAWAARNPDVAFAWLHRIHIALLSLSLVTIVGAMFGAHGASIF